MVAYAPSGDIVVGSLEKWPATGCGGTLLCAGSLFPSCAAQERLNAVAMAASKKISLDRCAYPGVTYRFEYVMLVYCELMPQKSAANILHIPKSILSDL